MKSCLVREFKEELGVDVQVGELLFVAETMAGNREVLHLVFKVTWLSGNFVLDKNHTTALAATWMDRKEIKEKNLYPAIGKELAEYLEAEYSGEIFLGRINQPWF